MDLKPGAVANLIEDHRALSGCQSRADRRIQGFFDSTVHLGSDRRVQQSANNAVSRQRQVQPGTTRH